MYSKATCAAETPIDRARRKSGGGRTTWQGLRHGLHELPSDLIGGRVDTDRTPLGSVSSGAREADGAVTAGPLLPI